MRGERITTLNKKSPYCTLRITDRVRSASLASSHANTQAESVFCFVVTVPLAVCFDQSFWFREMPEQKNHDGSQSKINSTQPKDDLARERVFRPESTRNKREFSTSKRVFRHEKTGISTRERVGAGVKSALGKKKKREK